MDAVGGATPVDVPVALPKPPVTLGTVVPVLLALPEPPVCVELPAVRVGLKEPPVCVELPETAKEPPVPDGTCSVAWVEATPPGTEPDVMMTPPP